MVWQPPNLTATCPANSQLTACTSFGFVYLNLLVSLYGGSEDERIQDKLREESGCRGLGADGEDPDGEEYDFIVVGAGTAGCVVANRLTEINHWKVLLLEAGPEQPDVTLVPGLSTPLLGSSVDWGYTSEPDGKNFLAREGGRCAWPRGKMMGGSSSINTMVYVRGHRLDYDGWAAAGNAGWSYKEVLPYFKKAEKNLDMEGWDRYYHGTDGPQSTSRYPFIDQPSRVLTQAFNQMGLPIIDVNGPHQEGTMQAQAYSQDGLRVSSNNAYIQPIRYNRKNLTVKTESQVIKILVDEHKKAYGIRYIKNCKLYTAKAKKEVIVSGGAVDSPKLLLLSGIGPKQHLEDLHIPVVQNLAVGENLQDHITFTGLIIAFSNQTATTVDNDTVLKLVTDFKKQEYKTGPLSSTGPFNSVAFFKTDSSLPAPDIQIQTASINWREYLRDPVDFERLGVLPSVFYDGVIPRVQNLVPKSRGRIFLNATNPHGPTLNYGNYLTDERDLITIKKGVQMLLKLENTEEFRSGRARFIKVPLPACKHTIWGTDEYTDCMARFYTFGLNHQVGSCKMGPEGDGTAVVDPRLRVYGVSGLRVIDASIMPVVIRGNTNAPTLVIGEKGSDLIKEDWMCGQKNI